MARHNILADTKIAVGFVAAVLFVLGLILVAQGFIDTRNYREEIIQVIKEQTGRDVTIKGKVSIALLPSPTLYIPGLELRGEEGDKPGPAVAIEMIRIAVPFTSVFSDRPRISGIAVDRPVLDLVRAHDNLIHWEWLNASLLKALAGSGGSGEPVSMTINEGKILYHDRRTDSSTDIQNINVSLTGGRQMASQGSFTFYGHGLQYTLDTTPDEKATLAEGDMPLHFRLFDSGKNALELNGSMNLSGELPKINGAMDVKVENMLAWVKAVPVDHGGNFLEQVTMSAVKKEVQQMAVLPLAVTGNWSQEGLNITLENANLQGMSSTGTGKIKLGWDDWQPSFTVDMGFTELNYNAWALLMSSVFVNKSETAAEKIYRTEDAPENPIPKDIQVTLNIKADKIHAGIQTWEQAELLAQLADGAITVNQCRVKLPGDSSLTLFGIVSQGSTRGLRFEGSMETQGESLRKMLTVFNAEASGMPETGMGAFYVRSNIFISSEQMRLSEADAKISDLRLNGGLVAYYDANPRLEADVKLKDINFDYFRDNWREKQKDSPQPGFFLKFDRSLNFDWLRSLNTNIDLKVGVEGFTFLERKGNSASFRIFVKQSEFGVYDMRFYYPEDTMEASLTLNVSGEQPYINLMLNADAIDTDYFSAVPRPVEPWPEGTFHGAGIAAPIPATVPEGMELMMPALPGTAPQEGTGEAAPGAVPAAPPAPLAPPAPEAAKTDVPPAPTAPTKLEVTPQAGTITIAQAEEVATPAPASSLPALPVPPKAAETIEDIKAQVAKKKDADTEGKQRWSEELIDVSWMEGFNGLFDISIGKLRTKQITLDRLKLQARLDNNLVTFQTLNFIYWQGRISVLGSMYGGKVPGLSLSFTLVSAELRDILKSLADRNNITGRVSVSGTLTTSGVNYLSWVSQSDAKLVLAGRGVTVQGLNMQGVVNAVAVSRTAADVFNNVNLALTNGFTYFSVDGNINVKNGVLKTPGITLKTGTIIGGLTGEVRLVPWNMELSTLFQFPAMTSETIPTMTVQLAGPINSPELRSDTSSLESYVAKRIISR